MQRSSGIINTPVLVVKMKAPPRTLEKEYHFLGNDGKNVYCEIKAKALFKCKAQLKATKFTRDIIYETSMVRLSEEERDELKKDSVEYYISDSITVSV